MSGDRRSELVDVAVELATSVRGRGRGHLDPALPRDGGHLHPVRSRRRRDRSSWLEQVLGRFVELAKQDRGATEGLILEVLAESGPVAPWNRLHKIRSSIPIPSLVIPHVRELRARGLLRRWVDTESLARSMLQLVNDARAHVDGGAGGTHHRRHARHPPRGCAGARRAALEAPISAGRRRGSPTGWRRADHPKGEATLGCARIASPVGGVDAAAASTSGSRCA